MTHTLSTLPYPERLHACNAHAPNHDGEFVLLWLHHAVRRDQNPAIDVAIASAHALGKPLLIYQGLAGNHRFNSDRHHAFILQGAHDLAGRLTQENIRFVFHLPNDSASPSPLPNLIARAAVFVLEDFPAPPFPRWSQALAARATCAVIAVDATCVLPMRSIKGRFDRAFSFRQAAQQAWAQVLQQPVVEQRYQGALCVADLGFVPYDFSDIDAAIATCKIDHSVGVIADTPGGAAAAHARWNSFKAHSLKYYAQRRNDAAQPGAVSRMSAYLHHGHISALQMARDVRALREDPALREGADKFLDELLVWRELSFHWCLHHRQPERSKVLPAWARDTFAAHQSDRRQLWSLQAMTSAQTGDEFWDLMQLSLLRNGELHNNVRMTWAKAIVSHSHDTDAALRALIDLNHRYALDGNNPNSYGGLLWALGLFDRPFQPEQKVMGALRSRPLSEHAARVDLPKFSATVQRVQGKRLDLCVVGAGLAGSTLAHHLHAAGHSVLVIDKSRGAGGRLCTRRVMEHGDSTRPLSFDHGAQYFTARDPRFRRYVQLWQSHGVVARWRPRLVEIDAEGMREKRHDRVPRYVALPAQNQLAKTQLVGVRTRFECTLQRIEREAWGYALFDQNDALIVRAQQLALCIPSVQASALLGDFPAAKAYADQARMLPCWALMVEFDSALACPFDGAFVNTGPLSWIARNSSKPGRGGREVDRSGRLAAEQSGERDAWVIHANAEFSAQHLEWSTEDMVATLLEAFRALMAKLGFELPAVRYRSVHRWRYALGSIDAGSTSGLSGSGDACYFDAELGLGLAGDWCGAGRVEGAFLSGSALAGHFLRHSARQALRASPNRENSLNPISCT